jgi:hypothetical protein
MWTDFLIFVFISNNHRAKYKTCCNYLLIPSSAVNWSIVYKCINHALKLHWRTKMYFSQCMMYGVVLFHYASTGGSAVELLVTFMRTYGHEILLRIHTSWVGYVINSRLNENFDLISSLFNLNQYFLLQKLQSSWHYSCYVFAKSLVSNLGQEIGYSC